MIRTTLFVAGGLLVAIVLHVAIVLLVPLFAVNDAWAKVGQLGGEGMFHVLPAESPLAGDPNLAEAVCRFALSPRAAHVRATLPDDFWSLAVFDRAGRNIYSFTDSATDSDRVDLVLATPEQAATLGDAPPATIANATVATLSIDVGLVVLRVFVPDAASEPGARAALAAAECNAPL